MTGPETERKDIVAEDVPATDARDRLTELMNRAGYGNERIGLTVHGKRTSVIVSTADAERLRQLDEAAQPAA